MSATVTSVSGTSGTSDTLEVSHGCTGDDRVLVVAVVLNSSTGTTCTGVTYNNVPLTLVRTEGNSDNTRRVYFWRLIAPDTGDNYILVTLSAVEQCIVCGISAKWVDQVTPVSNTISATGASGTATVDCPSVKGELVIDVLGSVDTGNAWTAGAGQVAVINVLQGTTRGGCSYKTATGTPVTMSWTTASSDRWVIASLSLEEVDLGLGMMMLRVG